MSARRDTARIGGLCCCGIVGDTAAEDRRADCRDSCMGCTDAPVGTGDSDCSVSFCPYQAACLGRPADDDRSSCRREQLSKPSARKVRLGLDLEWWCALVG